MILPLIVLAFPPLQNDNSSRFGMTFYMQPPSPPREEEDSSKLFYFHFESSDDAITPSPSPHDEGENMQDVP